MAKSPRMGELFLKRGFNFGYIKENPKVNLEEKLTFFGRFLKNGLSITDNSNEQVYNDDLDVILHIPKYSSTKKETIWFTHKGEVISKPNKKVTFKCLSCDTEHTVRFDRFLSKSSERCVSCREDDEKKSKQSRYISESFRDTGKITKIRQTKRKLTNLELIEKYNNEFESETSDFIKDYISTNLNEEEFNKFRKNIFEIKEYRLSDYNNIKFVIAYNSPNFKKYTPAVYVEDIDKILTFANVKYLCESCGEVFVASRRIKEKVEFGKIRCKTCCLCNKTFKVKKTFNILGEVLTYQSLPEKKLIDFCNANGVVLQNGKKVEYIFNGKKCHYTLDFYIPGKNIDLEIKDNHIWHKEQIESGKWDAKVNATKSLNFKLVFVDELDKFIETLK